MYKEAHFEYGEEFDEEFFSAAEDYEVEIVDHEEREGLTIKGAKSSVDDLLSQTREDIMGRATYRTMFGEQYNEASAIPEAEVTAETKPIMADGSGRTMQEVDHVGPDPRYGGQDREPEDQFEDV